MKTETLLTLLQQLIRIPSFSREEAGTADHLEQFLRDQGIRTERSKNNVWAVHPDYREDRPTLLLNSHHDTVRPNASYTRDPYCPDIADGRLYGLGSNDAGGPLVCLLGAYLSVTGTSLAGYNLIMAATAEEEISGANGIESILPKMPKIDMAIVGEPTRLRAAVAEKGLMVLDCEVKGKPGHAARQEGENAIYKAMEDIDWFRTFEFPDQSDYLGPVRMNVTVIKAGQQHNVVPDRCRFVVDVRTTDRYSMEETLEIIRSNVSCEVTPRSMRLRPSGLPEGHPLGQVISSLGIEKFGSPTLSDQALLDVPSLKIGPGDSARSHSADEFIYTEEIREGLELYQHILRKLPDHL